MEKLKALFNDTFGSVWNWAGKKLIVAAGGMFLMSLRAAHPDWPLPTEEFTRDILIALLSAHTFTDIAAVLKTAGKEALAGRATQ